MRVLIGIFATTVIVPSSVAAEAPLSLTVRQGQSARFETPVTNIDRPDPGNPDSALARFAAAAQLIDHQLDWQHWDEALNWIVIPMGPSLRLSAPRVLPRSGTRRIYGHESRLRLEGNRVAFSFMTPDIVAALGDYRADLERIGSELNIARLPRNEQLAYWLNLHNVAVIEALARAYPLSSPRSRTFGPDKATLDDAKLVTVAGVALTPRDIRERIVYANWQDPKVIYGFWRGEIGGPSLQRLAFTGDNVDQLLTLSAEEFVNSLRGVEAWGGAVRISRLYEEVAPVYFADEGALRSHLAKFAGAEVAALLGRYQQIRYAPYAADIADLSRGERDGSTAFVCNPSELFIPSPYAPTDQGACGTTATVLDPSALRLMRERSVKFERARRAGIRMGTVIVGDGSNAEGIEVK